MIDLDWSNDERNSNTSKYLVDPNKSRQNRLNVFLEGWKMKLKGTHNKKGKDITWRGLGAVCAGILGDIPVEQRKQIYQLLLGQFLASNKVKHWTDDERREAMRLVTD